ncbi:RBBP9/YdeN family alpha/beta hydrolase [Vibrio quintilis]|uniref:Alpha/beta hydrolase family protein n=1 Tax=Vibrio quintilis TaxID=1117707 RepID=A0A1M7YTX6_9VIBR|nr:alpha/beta hydrolase [Vibrio quintilis]SHO55991.1 Alpha/beta hydrolase family protein [Vibrio quintilis]
MHLLFLAGIGNSGPGHWQHQWYMESENVSWLEHSDWDNPVMEAWLSDLENFLEKRDEPVVVVAHSLGCVLFTEWLKRTDNKNNIAGAFLVAMPDVLDPQFPAQVQHFRNLDTAQECCPAVVITSDNDPFGTAEHAQHQARKLNVPLYNIGPVGHINAQSGLNGWAEGKEFLADLISHIKCKTSPEDQTVS